METLTSSEGADRLGINVQKFHRLADEHGIEPVLKAPGLRGAKFWLSRDIDRIAATLTAEAAS